MGDRRHRDSAWNQPVPGPAKPSDAPSPARDAWGQPVPENVGNLPAPVPATEITGPKQRGRPFQPGQSGNPAGRPKGARNRFTSKFITKFAAHFEKHGDEILDRLKDKPEEYMRLASFILVKDEVLPEFNSYEEAFEWLKEQSQYREIEVGLDFISNN